MPKTKEQKKTILGNLEDLLKRAKSLVLINYYGLKVKEIGQLRKALKNCDCQYVVAKKTLLRRAMDRTGLKDIDLDKIVGGLGLILGFKDEVAPAKLAMQFGKEFEKMKIHGGILDGKLVGPEQIKQLSLLPPKDRLLAQVVWTLKGPLSGLVNVTQGNIRSLVYVLQAVANKKS